MMGDNGFHNMVGFMGVVEDNDDPIHEGRVRVRCFGFHSNPADGLINKEDLPWAPVLNGSGGKFHAAPDNGAWVFGLFLGGRDAQHPIVMGVVNGTHHSMTWAATGGGRATAGASAEEAAAWAAARRGKSSWGTVTFAKAEQLALDAGFTPAEAKIMAAISMGESSGNPGAFNPRGRDLSYGLWQINMRNNLGPARRAQFGISKNEELFDPAVNAAAARKVYLEQGFDAWTVYSSGTWKKYFEGSS